MKNRDILKTQNRNETTKSGQKDTNRKGANDGKVRKGSVAKHCVVPSMDY
jgi:hypothetical protein